MKKSDLEKMVYWTYWTYRTYWTYWIYWTYWTCWTCWTYWCGPQPVARLLKVSVCSASHRRTTERVPDVLFDSF